MAKKGEKKPEQAPKPRQAPKRKLNPRKKTEEPDDSFAIGTNYYKILGVNHYASADEVKKAFKKLRLLWHPDKHLEEHRAEAEAKFKEINQAYQILGDPLQRRKYDALNAKLTKEEEFNNRYGFGFGFGTSRRTVPEPIVYTPVECSLEELFHGATKRMKLPRAVTNAMVEETMIVNVEPGYLHGTKLNYTPPGDTKRAGYVIEEKPHPVYQRENHDLIIHQEITLLEALTGGGTLDLTTLDGRKLVVPLADDVIRAPGNEMVVPGEGMPILKQPGVKGNLRIKFSVKFPTCSLTAEQKLDVKRGLEGVSF